MAKKKANPKVVIPLMIAQAVIGTFTVRDISQRSDDEVRGPKLLWKIWGGTNMLGSALYWLFGRRPASHVG